MEMGEKMEENFSYEKWEENPKTSSIAILNGLKKIKRTDQSQPNWFLEQ